jgi:hypothetical protein
VPEYRSAGMLECRVPSARKRYRASYIAECRRTRRDNIRCPIALSGHVGHVGHGNMEDTEIWRTRKHVGMEGAELLERQ